MGVFLRTWRRSLQTRSTRFHTLREPARASPQTPARLDSFFRTHRDPGWTLPTLCPPRFPLRAQRNGCTAPRRIHRAPSAPHSPLLLPRASPRWRPPSPLPCRGRPMPPITPPSARHRDSSRVAAPPTAAPYPGASTALRPPATAHSLLPRARPAPCPPFPTPFRRVPPPTTCPAPLHTLLWPVSCVLLGARVRGQRPVQRGRGSRVDFSRCCRSHVRQIQTRLHIPPRRTGAESALELPVTAFSFRAHFQKTMRRRARSDTPSIDLSQPQPLPSLGTHSVASLKAHRAAAHFSADNLLK